MKITDFKTNDEVIINKTGQKAYVQDVDKTDIVVWVENEPYYPKELTLTGETKNLIKKRD